MEIGSCEPAPHRVQRALHCDLGKVALAGAVVAALMFGAAAGIAIEAVREIRTPHHAPAPWTLAVLALVIVVKEVLAK